MKQFEEGKLYRSKKGVLLRCTKVSEEHLTVRLAEFEVVVKEVTGRILSYALKAENAPWFEEWWGDRDFYHDEWIESEFGEIKAENVEELNAQNGTHIFVQNYRLL
jgi:hypothetical protein